VETREFGLTGFARIEMRGTIEFQLERSDTYAIVATGEALRHIRVGRDGDLLRLGHAQDSLGRIPGGGQLKVRVTMPLLRELVLLGGGKGTVSGFASREALRLRLTEASNLKGDIEAGAADFELWGASILALRGGAESLALHATGANLVDLSAFRVHNADVRLEFATSGVVSLDGVLNAHLTGRSTLRWLGEPAMGDITVADFATLARKAY